MTRTLRAVFPILLRPAPILSLLFFGGWGVVLPFMFTALATGNDDLRILGPLLERTASEPYTRALWHLALILPTFSAGWLHAMRWDALERVMLWPVPGYHARYLRFEVVFAVTLAALIAALQLRMQGVAFAFQSFALVLFVFVLLDSTAWREEAEFPAWLLRWLVPMAILKPSWAFAVLQWQPVIVGSVLLALVPALYDRTLLVAAARRHTEENIVSSEPDAPRPARVRKAVYAEYRREAEEFPSLWRGGVLDWLRASGYERSYGRSTFFFTMGVWLVLLVLLGNAVPVAAAALWVRGSGGQFTLQTHYTASRSTRAGAYYLVSLRNLVLLLTPLVIAVFLSGQIRSLWGAQSTPLFGMKGTVASLALLIAVAPAMQWPFRNRAAGDAGSYGRVPVPSGRSLLCMGVILFGSLRLMQLVRDNVTPEAMSAYAVGLALTVQLVYWLLLRRHFARGDLI